MAKRPCYQCDDDLDELRDKRNAEIRAWGRKQLADADAALFKEPSDNNHWTAWDQESVVETSEPVPELTLSEPLDVVETSTPEPELTLPPEIQELVEKANDDIASGKSTAKPRTQRPKPTS